MNIVKSMMILFCYLFMSSSLFATTYIDGKRVDDFQIIRLSSDGYIMWFGSTNIITSAQISAWNDTTLAASTVYYITNTIVCSNSQNWNIGLQYNNAQIHNIRMYLSTTNGAPISKHGYVRIFENPDRRCDSLTYLDTDQLYYSTTTTVDGVAGTYTNVIDDNSGIILQDLYFKKDGGYEDYQRVNTVIASTIIQWNCTNLHNTAIGTLISHVNMFGSFPYQDETGSTNMYFTMGFSTPWTGTVRTVIKYGK